jgi:hypothetical protein
MSAPKEQNSQIMLSPDASDSQIITELKKISKEIKDGTFDGILVFSEKKEGRGFLRSGSTGHVDDRVMVLDLIIKEINTRPTEAVGYFYDRMYPIFKYIFGERFKEDISDTNKYRSDYVV